MDKKQKNPILISTENLEKFGFACFYQDQNPELINGFWIRDIELAIGASDPGIQLLKVKIPEYLLTKLPNSHKLADDKNFNISSGDSKVEMIKLLSERAGWNQTIADLESMISHEKGGIFMAKSEVNKQEISLGSGIAIPINSDMSWIGMILVHPELRRQGIARSIMNACVIHARLVQEKSIIGLDATPLGKQVYDSLGFKDSFLIWRSIISTACGQDYISHKAINPFNFKKVEEYLSGKNYSERVQIIKLLENLPDTKNIIAGPQDDIQGFVMSRPGRLKPFIGPLIADSEEIAKNLLINVLNYWESIGYSEVFMDIPEQHIGGEQLFIPDKASNIKSSDQIEVSPVRSLMRMYQLIPKENDAAVSAQMEREVGKQAMNGFVKTLAFMEKEKNDIVPIMYGTSGPEWS